MKTSGRVHEHLQFDIQYGAVDSRLTSGGSYGGRGRGRGRGARGNRGSGASRRGSGFGSRDGGDRDDRAAAVAEKEVAINEQYDSNFPSL